MVSEDIYAKMVREMMTTNTKEYHRDLQRDLEICERATPGPWIANVDVGDKRYDGHDEFIWGPKGPGYGTIAEIGTFDRNNQINDARFIAAARTGWPHAIRRAIEAEKRVAELEAENERLREQLRDLNEYKRLAEWGLRKIFGEERVVRHGI